VRFHDNVCLDTGHKPDSPFQDAEITGTIKKCNCSNQCREILSWPQKRYEIPLIALLRHFFDNSTMEEGHSKKIAWIILIIGGEQLEILPSFNDSVKKYPLSLKSS